MLGCQSGWSLWLVVVGRSFDVRMSEWEVVEDGGGGAYEFRMSESGWSLALVVVGPSFDVRMSVRQWVVVEAGGGGA